MSDKETFCIVIWAKAPTCFVVEATTLSQAVDEAVKANIEFRQGEGLDKDVTNRIKYGARFVDFNDLNALFRREDYRGIFENAMVFDPDDDE